MWAAGALRGEPASTTSDRAAGSGEDQGCGQAGGASADDRYVVLTHVPQSGIAGRLTYERCCLWETGVR